MTKRDLIIEILNRAFVEKPNMWNLDETTTAILALDEQSESKTAIKTAEEILRDTWTYFGITREDEIKEILEAMEEYRQQSQKEQEEGVISNLQVYHLTCWNCGESFWSDKAFPEPQLCHSCEQEEEKPTDEMIEKWARTIRIDFATEILIEGAKAMRDGLIPKR